MSRYIVVAEVPFDDYIYTVVERPAGYVANAVEWDGNTDNWGPPEGFYTELDDAGVHPVGSTIS